MYSYLSQVNVSECNELNLSIPQTEPLSITPSCFLLSTMIDLKKCPLSAVSLNPILLHPSGFITLLGMK